MSSEIIHITLKTSLEDSLKYNISPRILLAFLMKIKKYPLQVKENT